MLVTILVSSLRFDFLQQSVDFFQRFLVFPARSLSVCAASPPAIPYIRGLKIDSEQNLRGWAVAKNVRAGQGFGTGYGY
jgi:hypothetical protein